MRWWVSINRNRRGCMSFVSSNQTEVRSETRCAGVGEGIGPTLEDAPDHPMRSDITSAALVAWRPPEGPGPQSNNVDALKQFQGPSEAAPQLALRKARGRAVNPQEKMLQSAFIRLHLARVKAQ